MKVLVDSVSGKDPLPDLQMEERERGEGRKRCGKRRERENEGGRKQQKSSLVCSYKALIPS